jgi:hypothetical protein
MPFQKTVNRDPAIGIPGTPYTFGPEVITVKIAAEAVTVGRFVFAGNDDAGATVSNAGSGQPLGLAVVTKTEANLDIVLSEASMAVAAGNPVTVAERGGYYVVATADAVKDQAVYASLTDGTIVTDAPGATVAGHVETIWKVAAPAPAEEPIPIYTDATADFPQLIARVAELETAVANLSN